MTSPVTATTRMALRKREAPTTVLIRQRDALISRITKRPRSYNDDETETDAVDDDDDESSADTESDYEDRSARKATGANAAARMRAVPAGKPAHTDAASPTDKALTFLQSAQMQNNPVRSGKWNEDEEAYLRKLVQLFNAGLLDDVETKMSMRMWLAKMLHCCPMRISKKQMHGEKFKGKAKYSRNAERIMRLTQKEFDKMWAELHQLRANFLKLWAKEEFGRWGHADRSRDFGEWYDTVVRNVPKPRLAKTKALTVPDGSKIMEPWADVRQDIELVATKQREAVQEREVKRRLLHRTQSKRRVVACEPAGPTQEHVPVTCQSACCVVPTLDLPSVPQDAIFEPIPSLELEIDVDLAALVSQWDDCTANSCTPAKCFREPLSEAADASQLSPSIVLDFGPPSMWDVDPNSKDSSSPSHCEWVDDLLSDVSLLTPCDLPTEPWFQQLCATFEL